MAAAFNLTAQLNLKGPTNVGAITSSIKKQLGNFTANVDVKLNQSSIKNVAQLNSGLQQFNQTLSATTVTASSAANALAKLGQTVGAINIKNLPQQLAATSTAITQISSGSNQATKQLAETTTQMEEFGKQSALAVRRFAAFSIVTSSIYALSDSINKGIAAFIEYDQQFVKLQQVTGQSAQGLQSLSKEITSLSVGLGVSSSALTEVASTLAQAGLNAKDTEKALKALALSSLAPSFDSMNETVEGSIALMRQFGIGADGLEKALSSINTVAAKFAVEASDIITAVQRTGGVFATASKGVSEGTDALNEFIAVFTSVRATTRESAETIATGLRTIFTRIQRGSTIDALKEFGVNLQDTEGKFVGAYKAVELLSKGLNSLDPRDVKFSKIVEELGGFRQIGKVIPLIQQFSVAQNALKVAQQGQGSLAKDAATAQLSLANQIQKVRQEFLALFREMGQSQGFQVMVKATLSLASALIKVADASKGLLPALGVLLAFKGASAITQFTTGFNQGLKPGAGKKDKEKPLFSQGGPVRAFARGGVVPGSGDGDTVPAMLTPGEFVIRKKAVKAIGAQNLHKMNRYAGGGQVKKFGNGGGAWTEPVGSDIRVDKDAGPRVSDGDTFAAKVFTVKEYRLDAVDAAETNQKYGREATTILERYKPNLISDITSGIGGSYGRGKFKDDQAGSEIVSSGYGVPDFRYGGQRFQGDLDSARHSGRGIWNSSNINHPKRILFEAEHRQDLAKEIARKKGLPEETLKGRFNIGGLVQKFLKGGTVEETAQMENLSLQDAILAQIKELGGIGGVKKLIGTSGSDRTLDSLLRANVIKQKDAIDPKALKAVNDALSNEEGKQIRRAQQINKSQKLAVVGLQPFDKSEEIPLNLPGFEDSTIFVRGLSSKYAEAVAGMRQMVENTIEKFGTDIQNTMVFGGNAPLALDFDETLVSGADIFGPDGKPDIPAYSDLNKVAAGLQKGELTPLGEKIKEIVGFDPSFLNRIRVLTARPQSNDQLLSQKLNELGIPLGSDKITGVSGGNKGIAMGMAERLIDDNIKNINDAKKAGKSAVQYRELRRLSEEEKAATGNANAEGAILEAALAKLGAVGGSVQNRAVDFENGLGMSAAQAFPGIAPDWPTEVKRTLSSDNIGRAKEEFTRYYSENYGPWPQQENAFDFDKAGKPVARFAQGGKASRKVSYEAGRYADGGVAEPEQKKEKQYGQIGLKIGNGRITAEYLRQGMSLLGGGSMRSGEVTADKNGSIYTVQSAGATDGFGPKLYDIVMEAATANGSMLTSDRHSVSDEAYRVWNYYFKNRGDVKKTPLSPEYWYHGQKWFDQSKFPSEDPKTWAPKSDEAWTLLTGYSKSPSLINDPKLVQKLASGGAVELYHGSNTGVNDSVLKSFKENGALSNIAQGYGQGAGFYVYSGKEKAKEQAMMRVKGGLGSFTTVSGDTAGKPMVLTFKEMLDPATWDLDYELNKGSVVKWLADNYDKIKDKVAPGEKLTGIKDVVNADSSKGIMSQGIKIQSDTGSRKTIYSGTDSNLREGELLGQIMSRLKASDPKIVGDFENTFFNSPSLASGEWDNLALKYVGSSPLKPTNIETFAKGGSVEDTVPALLTPGEFVVNKQAAQKIGYNKLHQLNHADKIAGYNKGGVVGGVQTFAIGGAVTANEAIDTFINWAKTIASKTSEPPKLLARPDTVSRATLQISDNTQNSIKEVIKALNDLGISASDSAALINKGGDLSYKAIERALQKDIERMNIAGASIDQISAAEKVLATVRSESKTKVGQTQKLENSFRNSTVGQKLGSGGAQQAIILEAAKIQESLKQQAIKFTASKLQMPGLPGATQADKIKRATEIVNSPETKAYLKERAYLRATQNVTGVSKSEFRKEGLSGSDIQKYVTESLRDRKTLASMDKQLIAFRMEEYKNAGTVRGISVNSAKEAKALADQEVSKRREIINNLAKASGQKGVGAAGLTDYRNSPIVQMIKGALPKNRTEGIGMLATGGAVASGLATTYSSTISNSLYDTRTDKGKIDAARTGVQISNAGTIGSTGLAIAAKSLAVDPSGITAGVIALGTAAVAAADYLGDFTGAQAKAVQEVEKSIRAKEISAATASLKDAFKKLESDLNNLDFQTGASQALSEAVGKQAKDTTGNISSTAADYALQNRSWGDLVGDKKIAGRYIPFAGMNPKGSAQMDPAQLKDIYREEADKFSEFADSGYKQIQRSIDAGASMSQIMKDKKLRGARAGVAMGDAEGISLYTAKVKGEERATGKPLSDIRRKEIIDEVATIVLSRKEQLIAAINTRKLAKAMEEADAAGRKIAQSFDKLFDSISQAINKNDFNIEQRKATTEYAMGALSGNPVSPEFNSKNINILQYPKAYSSAEFEKAASVTSQGLPAQDAALIKGAAILQRNLAPAIESSIRGAISGAPGAGIPGQATLGLDDAAGLASKAAKEQIFGLKGVPEELKQNILDKVNAAINIQKANPDLREGFDKGNVSSVDRFLESIKEVTNKALNDAGKGASEKLIELETKRQQAFNEFNKNLARSSALQKAYSETLNKAKKAVADFKLDVRKAITGKSESFTETKSRLDADTARLTGGLTDPTAIGKQIKALQEQGSLLAKQRDKAYDEGNKGGEAEKFATELQKVNDKLANSTEALDKIANSGELASKALEDIADKKSLLQSRTNVTESLLTQSPEEAKKRNDTFLRLQNNANGGLNGAINSREVRLAFNEALRTGKGLQGAYRAANTVGSQQRSEVLNMLKDPDFKNMMIMQSIDDQQKKLGRKLNPDSEKDQAIYAKQKVEAERQYAQYEYNVKNSMAQETGQINNPLMQAELKTLKDRASGDVTSGYEMELGAAKKAAELQSQALNAQAKLIESQQALINPLTELKTSIDGLTTGITEARLGDAATEAGNAAAAVAEGKGFAVGVAPGGGVGPWVRNEKPFAKGGVVYADKGTLIDFEPKGTDTVPAMLTPGEFVVNARATQQNLPLLQAINKSKGGVVYLSGGGMSKQEAYPSPHISRLPLNQELAEEARGIDREYRGDQHLHERKKFNYTPNERMAYDLHEKAQSILGGNNKGDDPNTRNGTPVKRPLRLINGTPQNDLQDFYNEHFKPKDETKGQSAAQTYREQYNKVFDRTRPEAEPIFKGEAGDTNGPLFKNKGGLIYLAGGGGVPLNVNMAKKAKDMDSDFLNGKVNLPDYRHEKNKFNYSPIERMTYNLHEGAQSVLGGNNEMKDPNSRRADPIEARYTPGTATNFIDNIYRDHFEPSDETKGERGHLKYKTQYDEVFSSEAPHNKNPKILSKGGVVYASLGGFLKNIWKAGKNALGFSDSVSEIEKKGATPENVHAATLSAAGTAEYALGAAGQEVPLLSAPYQAAESATAFINAANPNLNPAERTSEALSGASSALKSAAATQTAKQAVDAARGLAPGATAAAETGAASVAATQTAKQAADTARGLAPGATAAAETGAASSYSSYAGPLALGATLVMGANDGLNDKRENADIGTPGRIVAGALTGSAGTGGEGLSKNLAENLTSGNTENIQEGLEQQASGFRGGAALSYLGPFGFAAGYGIGTAAYTGKVANQAIQQTYENVYGETAQRNERLQENLDRSRGLNNTPSPTLSLSSEPDTPSPEPSTNDGTLSVNSNKPPKNHLTMSKGGVVYLAEGSQNPVDSGTKILKGVQGVYKGVTKGDVPLVVGSLAGIGKGGLELAGNVPGLKGVSESANVVNTTGNIMSGLHTAMDSHKDNAARAKAAGDVVVNSGKLVGGVGSASAIVPEAYLAGASKLNPVMTKVAPIVNVATSAIGGVLDPKTNPGVPVEVKAGLGVLGGGTSSPGGSALSTKDTPEAQDEQNAALGSTLSTGILGSTIGTAVAGPAGAAVGFVGGAIVGAASESLKVGAEGLAIAQTADREGAILDKKLDRLTGRNGTPVTPLSLSSETTSPSPEPSTAAPSTVASSINGTTLSVNSNQPPKPSPESSTSDGTSSVNSNQPPKYRLTLSKGGLVYLADGGPLTQQQARKAQQQAQREAKQEVLRQRKAAYEARKEAQRTRYKKLKEGYSVAEANAAAAEQFPEAFASIYSDMIHAEEVKKEIIAKRKELLEEEKRRKLNDKDRQSDLVARYDGRLTEVEYKKAALHAKIASNLNNQTGVTDENVKPVIDPITGKPVLEIDTSQSTNFRDALYKRPKGDDFRDTLSSKDKALLDKELAKRREEKIQQQVKKESDESKARFQKEYAEYQQKEKDRVANLEKARAGQDFELRSRDGKYVADGIVLSRNKDRVIIKRFDGITKSVPLALLDEDTLKAVNAQTSYQEQRKREEENPRKPIVPDMAKRYRQIEAEVEAEFAQKRAQDEAQEQEEKAARRKRIAERFAIEEARAAEAAAQPKTPLKQDSEQPRPKGSLPPTYYTESPEYKRAKDIRGPYAPGLPGAIDKGADQFLSGVVAPIFNATTYFASALKSGSGPDWEKTRQEVKDAVGAERRLAEDKQRESLGTGQDMFGRNVGNKPQARLLSLSAEEQQEYADLRKQSGTKKGLGRKGYNRLDYFQKTLGIPWMQRVGIPRGYESDTAELPKSTAPTVKMKNMEDMREVTANMPLLGSSKYVENLPGPFEEGATLGTILTKKGNDYVQRAKEVAQGTGQVVKGTVKTAAGTAAGVTAYAGAAVSLPGSEGQAQLMGFGNSAFETAGQGLTEIQLGAAGGIGKNIIDPAIGTNYYTQQQQLQQKQFDKTFQKQKAQSEDLLPGLGTSYERSENLSQTAFTEATMAAFGEVGTGALLKPKDYSGALNKAGSGRTPEDISFGRIVEGRTRYSDPTKPFPRELSTPPIDVGGGPLKIPPPETDSQYLARQLREALKPKVETSVPKPAANVPKSSSPYFQTERDFPDTSLLPPTANPRPQVQSATEVLDPLQVNAAAARKAQGTIPLSGDDNEFMLLPNQTTTQTPVTQRSWQEFREDYFPTFGSISRGLYNRGTRAVARVRSMITPERTLLGSIGLGEIYQIQQGYQQRKQAEEEAKKKRPKNKAAGGIIYAANGALMSAQAKGTDTVPAMLTPGEFVVNRESTQQYLPLLRSINSGNYAQNGGIIKYMAQGGFVTPQYKAVGGETSGGSQYSKTPLSTKGSTEDARLDKMEKSIDKFVGIATTFEKASESMGNSINQFSQSAASMPTQMSHSLSAVVNGSISNSTGANTQIVNSRHEAQIVVDQNNQRMDRANEGAFSRSDPTIIRGASGSGGSAHA